MKSKLVRNDVRKVLRALHGYPELTNSIKLWHFDPPWPYRQKHRTGSASNHYDELGFEDISQIIRETYYLAAEDAFMVMWITMPMLMDPKFCHLRDVSPWNGYSGALWGKTSGLGTGNIVRGDVELALIYRKTKKGKVKGKAHSNLWLADRGAHSEKPQIGLENMLIAMTQEEDMVFDAFCGRSASMPIACRRLRRRYMAVEVDKDNFDGARRRLSQLDIEYGEEQESTEQMFLI